MARDKEALKLSKSSSVWSTTSANRAPQDLTSLRNPLVRENGWTSEYSVEASGENLQRLVWNRLLHELSTFSADLNQIGVLEYDASIDYQMDAVVNHRGALFRAVIDSGPSSSNATTPGTDSAVWVGLFVV